MDIQRAVVVSGEKPCDSRQSSAGPVNPLAVSHCLPHLPDAHVAICPGPAGQTILSRAHDPQELGSDEGTPQVGGVVSRQVVHPLQPTVGSGELQKRRKMSVGMFVKSQITVPTSRNSRRTRRRVTSILPLLTRRPGVPLTVLNDFSTDSFSSFDRKRQGPRWSSIYFETADGEDGGDRRENMFELHLPALVRHFVEL